MGWPGHRAGPRAIKTLGRPSASNGRGSSPKERAFRENCGAAWQRYSATVLAIPWKPATVHLVR
jgi:hypothetical protein